MKKLTLKLIDPVDAFDKREQWEKTFRDTMAGQ